MFLVSSPQIMAQGLFQRLSLILKPTVIFSLGGNFNDTNKLKDVLNPGLGLGVGLRFEVTENFYLDAGYSYNWLSFKEFRRPYIYRRQRPAFEMQMFSLNSTLFYKSGYKIEPFLTFGGIYTPWKFTQDSFKSALWPAPGNQEVSFSDQSLCLNVGLGVEYFAWGHLSIIFEIKYNYLFSRNPERLGTDDFTQQDFLSISLGTVFKLERK